MNRDLEAREVNVALQRAMVDEAMPSLSIGLVMMVATVLFLYERVPATPLMYWGGAIALLTAIRLGMIAQSRRKRFKAIPLRLYSWLMVVTGALWGAIILLWSAQLALVDQLVIALIPVIAAMGGIFSLGNWPMTYLGYISGLAVSMIFCMSSLADENLTRLLIPLVLIASGCLYCSYRLFQQKRETLLLRLRNQRALRSKDEFLARMSHELRTPMNGVLGMVRMLSKTSLNEEQQALVATLNQSGEDMMGLVSDLLDSASLSSHDVRLASEPCNLHAVMNELQIANGAKLSSKDVELSMELDPAIPVSISLDAVRWRQLCQKILDNAIHFTDRGHISVQLKYIDGNVVMSIRDTGCGIEESQLKAVMGVFHQATSHSGRQARGVGVGLHIVQSLVDLMGGTLKIDSELGQGTCVTVCVALPECSVPAEPELVSGKSVLVNDIPGNHLMPAGNRSTGHVRALVAEDNPVNQLVIEAALEDLGCEITLVDNGLEALLALQSGTFDIIFMDCQMPALDGFEATRQARDNGCRIPIVAVTANAVAGDRERCLEAGMDDYVSKPIADDALQLMLEKWLDRPPLQTPSACAA